MIVILFLVFAYIMYIFLGGANRQKFTTMKENATRFANTVATNIASFHNTETVYLEEVIDEELLKKIKSPFSPGDCDIKESKVVITDNGPLVTLKCDQYLIDNSHIDDLEEMKIYEVSDWSLKKDGDDVEAKRLYNCLDNNKEIYSNYVEEFYMVFAINRDYKTDYYFSSDISSTCKVASKTFYRTKKLLMNKLDDSI